MNHVSEPADLAHAVPCPVCGYDLRGHPDQTRCPECGRDVHAGEAMHVERRWVDRALVDLWSIGVLQVVGLLAALVSAIAITRGQYLAVVLGMMALVYLAASAVWFVIALLVMVAHHRRPAYASVDAARRARLRKWICIDGLLILCPIIPLVLRWAL
jgi:hypothetical protein